MSEASSGNYSMGAAGSMQAPKRAKEYLLQDLKKMDQGNLGLSSAQKQQMTQSAQQAAAAQAGAQQADLRQKQMAAGSGFSGYEAEASRQLATGAGEAAAGTAQKADVLGAQMAQTREKETRGRLERQQERSRDNARYWAQFGVDVNESVAAIVAMGGEMYGDFAGGGM